MTARKRHRARPIWLKAALIILLFVIGLWIYASIQVINYAGESHDAPADAAIILGAAVWYGVPTPVFEERIKHGINLYKRGKVRVLIFTGGVGWGDEMSEAEVARRYALARGVDEDDVFCEAESRVTYGNLFGAEAIMTQEGLTTALIVSDPLHMKRAVTMARDVGIQAYASPTPTTRYRTWRTKAGFLLRESRLYVSYLIRRPFIQHRFEQPDLNQRG